MVKRVLHMVLVGALFGLGGVTHAEESVENECRQIAKEEGIPAEEREEFVAQCIEDMKSEAGEKKSSE